MTEETELCISPLCSLSEDELDAINDCNASFAMWQPYKDKTRADEAEKKVKQLEQKLIEYKGYKDRALEAEKRIRELSQGLDLSIDQGKDIEDTISSRWVQCLTNLKGYADYQTDDKDEYDDKDDGDYRDKFMSLEKRVEETEYKLKQILESR
jgi:hypothetical protein